MNIKPDQKDYSPEQKKVIRRRFPIRMKITMPYLFLSLILAVVSAYVFTQFITENVEERFNKQLFEAGKISSELIVGYETQLMEVQRLLANVEGVPSAIVSKNPDKLKSLTIGIIANAQLDAVEFLDIQGDHLLSVHHRKDGNPEEYDNSTGGQSLFSNLEIVQNILQRKSDLRGDKFVDLVKTEKGNFLYISKPVYSIQNDLVGVILVGKSLESMADDMHTKTFAQISFYDQSGQVIYSTLPFPHNLTPEMAVQTISLKDVSSTKRDLSNQRDFNAVNISFAEILGSWEVRGEKQIGVLGVALSKSALVVTSTDSRWRIFFLVASALLLIILLGINLANTITRPLLRLVNASKKVAEGDVNIMVLPQSYDEVADLTESFNKMVASLNHSQNKLVQSYDETLEGWANALELRDEETVGHSKRVTSLTVKLAQAMGINDEALVNIRRGALLHDIGKMGTPDAILHKIGPLDEEEWEIIKNHAMDGYDLLKKIDFLGPALEIPLYHHEKWDGTGYPGGLKGEEIPISARIFAIVDVFDAMSNDRVYRSAIPIEETIKYLNEQSGGHFDPAVVKVFIHLLSTD
jgi:putative nucleotidyltransferase with HDIG domain